MSIAVLDSRALCGIDAPPVRIEVHLSGGLPAFHIVGLPEKAVKESKDRVRSAILISGFSFPSRRITVNLAPADLPKQGGRYDLPIALGILAASSQLDASSLSEYEFAGELALTGELRAIKGTLSFAIATQTRQRTLILPQQNGKEASFIQGLSIITAPDLLSVCHHLVGTTPLVPLLSIRHELAQQSLPDLKDIKGQQHAKRVLEIAAAGRHSLLLKGPPGTGKTMLASRLPSISPPMTEQQARESAAIYSQTDQGFLIDTWKKRPFRSPHHTASSVALVGGGSVPRPGEISLAHHGVLFLDELPEFSRQVLESLREPLEAKTIRISRATSSVCFPADFQFIVAMNPCPCGYFGDANSDCHCSMDAISRYQAKISGPLLDRIDLHITVPRLSTHYLLEDNQSQAEHSGDVQKRVVLAQHQSLTRQQCLNTALTHQQIQQHCRLSLDTKKLFKDMIDRFHLSARACHRVLKVARTIADLESVPDIQASHLREAMGYRPRKEQVGSC